MPYCNICFWDEFFFFERRPPTTEDFDTPVDTPEIETPETGISIALAESAANRSAPVAVTLDEKSKGSSLPATGVCCCSTGVPRGMFDMRVGFVSGEASGDRSFGTRDCPDFVCGTGFIGEIESDDPGSVEPGCFRDGALGRLSGSGVLVSEAEASDDGDENACGTLIGVRHAGHATRRPAIRSLSRSCFPQPSHRTIVDIRSSLFHRYLFFRCVSQRALDCSRHRNAATVRQGRFPPSIAFNDA